jgi:endogenous inhibitor of DNA gyrase (YacG/DUF329 family)
MQRNICQHCQKEFFANKSRNRKYCCQACAQAVHSTRKERKCPECGEKFFVRKRSEQVYCSTACSNKVIIRNRDKGKRVWWKCPICQKKFLLQRSRAKSRKYCSVKCQSVGASYRLRGKRHKDKVEGKRRVTVYKKADRIYDKGKRKSLHRYLIEQKIGRELIPAEQVHHIDLNVSNNEITNLWLYKNGKEHMVGHHSMQRLIPALMKKGIVFFKEGEYILTND